ncbi:MAG: hypothetical protein GXX88_12595, partial [Candidatus Hydrogenedentes bacterium]|nr:hypothetical protein [Candidatus Hydrogenedentota bacterium]
MRPIRTKRAVGRTTTETGYRLNNGNHGALTPASTLLLPDTTLLLSGCLLDNADDRHQEPAADTTAGNTADDAADIHAATAGARPQQGLEYLSANTAPDNPG